MNRDRARQHPWVGDPSLGGRRWSRTPEWAFRDWVYTRERWASTPDRGGGGEVIPLFAAKET